MKAAIPMPLKLYMAHHMGYQRGGDAKSVLCAIMCKYVHARPSATTPAPAPLTLSPTIPHHKYAE